MISIFRRLRALGTGFDPAFSRSRVRPLCSIESVKCGFKLTRGERNVLEPGPPSIGDFDLVVFVILVLAAVPHVVSVSD